MKGHVGDRLVVRGHRVGEPDRDAEILQVHGGAEEPPFTVRWSDTGHETLIFPGADARVVRTPRRAPVVGGIRVEWLGESARTSDGPPCSHDCAPATDCGAGSRGRIMGSKDRVGHYPKRKPEHTLAEKRQARREEKQTLESGKRKRRTAASHRTTTG